ncbi:MAG: thymidine phosphorylase [Myxococcota bacterium]
MGNHSTPELIRKKRDGEALSEEAIRGLIEGYVAGAVTDYQMSALAMAIYFQGMTPKETASLTLAMRDSGMVVDFRSLKGPKIDKHSTGGVGDKVSICLAPMAAAAGLYVPMVSGRGLGHTGGTLDKLEAIEGFRVDTTVAQFKRQVRKLGCALIGQTADIAPADKRLYALRDVTGTVESIPLITASILSKKLAEGIDGLVLDVKVGTGAFMKNRADARALAKSIVRTGRLANKKTTAVLTSMEQPLGRTVGNAMETQEALKILHGEGPEDLRELTLALGAEMLLLGGLSKSRRAAERALETTIEDGSALRRMRDIVEAQGGDPRVVDEPDRLPRAKVRVPVRAPRAGFLGALDALEVGLASVGLGAGRTRSDDVIDPTVGIELHRKVGDRVDADTPIATVFATTRTRGRRAAERVGKACTIKKSRPKPTPLILETIRR